MRLYARSAAIAAVVGCLALTTTAEAGGSLKDGPLPGVHVDWSGLYVGIHGGAGWSKVSTEIIDPPWLVDAQLYTGLPASHSQDVDGWLAGGHIGLQRQYGRLVLGIEASLTGGRLEGSSNSTFAGEIGIPEINIANFDRELGGGISWFGSTHLTTKIGDIFMLAGRVGHARERWLAYLKGGFASAEIDVKAQGDVTFIACEEGCSTFASGSASSQSSARHHGFVLGGGLEYMIKPNVVFGVEYNYIDLQAKTHKALTTVRFDDASETFDARVRVDPDAIHTVMARLSYKFGHEPAKHAPLK